MPAPRSFLGPSLTTAAAPAIHPTANPRGDPISIKVASGQAIPATSGAFQNITALLPPALQTYLGTTLAHVSDAVAGSSQYLESRGASPTAVYSTLLGATAIVLPVLMSSWYPWRRGEGLSPLSSGASSRDGPHVTDDDFSYITSEDLENTLDNSLQPPQRAYDRHSHRAPRSPVLEDDVLIIRDNKLGSWPVQFPAYSIGDGRLTVQDVRDRAVLVMDLKGSRAARIKMLYKGRNLKEHDIPIRDYGVKNNSELLVVMPEGKFSEDDESSGTAEELVNDSRGDLRSPKKKKNKNGKKKPKHRGPRETTNNLEVPGSQTEGTYDGDGKWTSPDPSRHPSRVPSPAVPSGAIEKLAAIRTHFDTQLLPLCQQFMRRPPKEAKKLEDEHRKLSETVMQHVLLKLDEVDTGGDIDIRARRKDLVNYVQDILKKMDDQLPAGIKPNR
ncbi:BAG domain-containing protein [Nemania sp. FL0916]|nr:BAG domain-containing protein [Nemania sp. FL0916]